MHTARPGLHAVGLSRTSVTVGRSDSPSAVMDAGFTVRSQRSGSTSQSRRRTRHKDARTTPTRHSYTTAVIRKTTAARPDTARRHEARHAVNDQAVTVADLKVCDDDCEWGEWTNEEVIERGFY